MECPSLKGCVSQGKTKEEALSNIKEAIVGYIAALEEDGLPVPKDNFEAYLTGPNSFPCNTASLKTLLLAFGSWIKTENHLSNAVFAKSHGEQL